MNPIALFALLPLIGSATAEIQPSTPTAIDLYHQARMAAYQHQIPEAIESASTIIRLFPEHPLAPEAALWSVWILLDEGRADVAGQLLDWIMEQKIPDEMRQEALYLQARVALVSGKTGEAMVQLKDISPANPLFGADALLLRLELAEVAGISIDDRIGWLRDFMRYYPRDRRADAYKLEMLDRLEQSTNPEEARKFYEDLAASGDTALGAEWALLSDLSTELKSDRLDEAMAIAAGALQRVKDPRLRPMLAREIARRFRAEGAFPILMAELARVTRTDLNNQELASRIATLVELAEAAATESLRSSTGPDAGEAEIRRALPLRDLYHLLLFHYAKAGQAESLDRWAKTALKRFPDDARSYELAAALFYRMGEKDRSRALLIEGLRRLKDESVREEIEAALEGIRDASSLAPADILGYAPKRR